MNLSPLYSTNKPLWFCGSLISVSQKWFHSMPAGTASAASHLKCTFCEKLRHVTGSVADKHIQVIVKMGDRRKCVVSRA